jgi:hypothetical protein
MVLLFWADVTPEDAISSAHVISSIANRLPKTPIVL